MEQERLDKLLCATGRYTRAEARRLIASGRVTVDGAVVRRPEAKVCRSSAVMAGGEALDTAEFVYYMMNKPAGYISTGRDRNYPSAEELLPEELRKRGLFPAGRLDADVTGLLLLTDDGAYAHRVTSPRSGVEKVYRVHADGVLTEKDVKALAAGVIMEDGTAYRPAVLAVSGEDARRGLITVTEGKYHEVKNLLASRGRRVLSLERVAIGGLRLDGALGPGRIRRLTPEEAEAVFYKNV